MKRSVCCYGRLCEIERDDHPHFCLNEEVLKVSCGSRHVLALTESSKLLSWGWNGCGQIGVGEDGYYSEPQEVNLAAGENLEILDIAAGGCHSVAVTKCGKLFTWGHALYGQIGSVERRTDRFYPAEVNMDGILDDGERMVEVSCGGQHTVIRTSFGRLFAFGRGDNGQLGIGHRWLLDADEIVGIHIPTPVRNVSNIKHIACGAFLTAAITDKGVLYTFGKSDYGMLGSNTAKDEHKPVKVELPEPVVYVSCGGWHVAVIGESGALYSWGRGEYGRLGHGNTKSLFTPAQVMALEGENVVDVHCAGSHTIIHSKKSISGDASEAIDKYYACGRGDFGRLLAGSSASKGAFATPLIMEELHLKSGQILMATAGGSHTVVVSACN